MKNFMKKIIAIILLISSCGIFAKGHGGGHHGGGHHSGHHGSHHAGHHGHHGGHFGHRGYHHYAGWGHGWNTAWGWGSPYWAWGATAAIVAGAFVFGGYTINQWQQMAAQNPDQRTYYQTVVLPAYQQYKQNPNSVPVRDMDAQMTDQDNTEPMEINIDYQNYPVRPCCTDGQAYSQGYGWFDAGPDRQWREENIAPDNFTIYRRSEFRPVSFTDLAEQPAISGFEQSVYTSPK